MKRIYQFVLMLLLCLSIDTFAQQPGDSRPLADRTSAKAKTELRREKRILRNERKHDQKLQVSSVKHDRSKGKITIIPAKWKRKLKREPKETKHKKDKGRNATAGEKPKM